MRRTRDTVTNIAHCRLYLWIKITLLSWAKHLLVILQTRSNLKGKCRVNIKVGVRYISLSVSDPQSYRQWGIKVYVVCMDVYVVCVQSGQIRTYRIRFSRRQFSADRNTCISKIWIFFVCKSAVIEQASLKSRFLVTKYLKWCAEGS